MFEIRDDHYELLEVPSDASFQEIRNAYLRLKAMLNRDNLAGYALMSREEAEELQKKTEEAYLTLSNPARRREYDRIRKEARIAAGEECADADPQSAAESDRAAAAPHPFFDAVPSRPSEASELEIPSTDFPGAKSESSGGKSEPKRPNPFDSQIRTRESPTRAATVQPNPHEHRNPSMLERGDNSGEIADRLARESDWNGLLIRWVREKRGLTIEELSELTKISRSYLVAIEEERFEKLPAAVYLRGFMLQVARYLRLPQDKLVTAFISRASEARRRDGQR